MRALFCGVCLALISSVASAQSDPAAPVGKLSDAATPSAYRLDFIILPDQPRFSGHTEIDVTLKAGLQRLYMHGRNLKVGRAVARVGAQSVTATWTQVDPTGVVRLDFASPLPAGPVTLAFDYDAPFGDSPSGLYHIKVADKWYSWTQFESIDARAAYPSFDEPGFKTPFTISVTTRPGEKTISNAPEASVTKVGDMEIHRFSPTKPLPTYLVAIDTGPFLHPAATIAPDAQRPYPLPLGAVATQAQAGKLDFVLAQTPRIVSLLEGYFGQPFPFPKLDQIASPEMPGAMENAGADTYADELILLDPGATVGQKQAFGMVVAHELSHQWFGDLVSPAWWDDIWLNESFANWMGYRIGNAWRPDLNIGVGALDEGFGAMNTDALEVGRPIHQHIATNAEIDSAFDTITYGKGGQVVAMIAAFMGDDAFKAGVRLHLARHAYGNATTDQFFASLADAAHDPRIVPALRSFVDQPGVPLVTFTRQGDSVVASQSRYAFYGSKPAPEHWGIPLCVRVGATRSCTLMDGATTTIAAGPHDLIVPNAGGAGYYRFDLPAADWQALLPAMATLPAGEALAADDSLWASFRAGRAPAANLIAEARSMSANPDANASVVSGQRLAGLRLRGFVADAVLPDYRRLMAEIYAPKLAKVGFRPDAGAYANEDPNLQNQRQSLVSLVAREAQDLAVNAQLIDAAKRYLAGDAKALDQTYMRMAFTAYIKVGGVPAAQTVVQLGLGSEDAILRSAALGAVSETGRTDVAAWLLDFSDPRLRPPERMGFVFGLTNVAETRDMAADWLLAHYDQLTVGANGIFFTSRLPSALRAQCSADRSVQMDKVLGPKVKALGAGVLEFERTVEVIRHCADLKAAREGELTAALQTSH
jgi:aminopeptidase N